MRPSNKSRSRNKSGGSGNNNHNRRSVGNIVNRVFDSAGPDGKVRGTPQQIIDKYLALARDAQVGNDRVAAESFLQHAEHYSRMLGEAQRQQMEQRGASEREGFRSDESGPRSDEGNVPRGSEAPSRPDERAFVRADDGGARRDENESVPQRERTAAPGGGLTTFGAEDEGEISGPVETPEATRARAVPDAPRGRERRGGMRADADSGVNGFEAQPAAAVEGSEAGNEAPEAQPAPKRPRTRRKAKPEPESVEAQPE